MVTRESRWPWGVFGRELTNIQLIANVITTGSAAMGTGNVTGKKITIGRNSSGSGAAAVLNLIAANGTNYFLWVDATGDLRIGTAAPEEDGTPSDTSGTVVGTQT